MHQGYHVATQGLQCEKNKSACIFRNEPKQNSEKKYFGKGVITAESNWASLHVEDQRKNVIPALDVS